MYIDHSLINFIIIIHNTGHTRSVYPFFLDTYMYNHVFSATLNTRNSSDYSCPHLLITIMQSYENNTYQKLILINACSTHMDRLTQTLLNKCLSYVWEWRI